MRRVAFESPQLAVAADFWAALARRKLHDLRLDSSPHPLIAHYEPGVHGRPSLLHVTHASLVQSNGNAHQLSLVSPKPHCVFVKGTIRVFNSVEEYRSVDKAALMASARDAILAGSEDAIWVLAYADLKRHIFCYHALHAAVFDPRATFFAEECAETLSAPDLAVQCNGLPVSLMADGSVLFVDPCGAEGDGDVVLLGWPLRNVLHRMLVEDRAESVRVLAVRDSSVLALIVRAHWTHGGPSAQPEVTGWERDASGRTADRVVDLSKVMDAALLAREANALNLRLMRWRLAPGVDLDVFGRQRVLILGAGTLGCNVARCLLGWGVRHVTFVDSGRVSYSNPVRQSLYRHVDCAHGGAPKAPTAAARLLEIDPTLAVDGVDLEIPMPGHRLSETTRAAVEHLWTLVRAHDVVFLLTDSRESRWLPTVLAASSGCLAITAAIGFDAYVAMRHGLRDDVCASDSISTESNANGHLERADSGREIGKCALSEGRLGCYFCSDASAPGDTLSGRTLDQQCTVSRPGVSMMAAAAAVELLASVLQHPEGARAPAVLAMPTVYERLADSGSEDNCETPRRRGRTSTVLGVVPHQVRGFLSHQQQIHLVGAAYSHCTACSPAVMEGVRTGGVDYIMAALADPLILVSVSDAAANESLDVPERRQSTSDGDFVLV